MAPPDPLYAWLRANPLAGRLVLRLGTALPLGLATGLLLSAACEAAGISQNFAAVGAAVAALLAGTRLADALAARLGIPPTDP
ncbi:conserved protein of unknown function [Rhodovastum atsumiense]|uniref:Uncharacterized protein n=1 Tax=Rhodovastum atsumiense TaxID=504468 RepID=A0A5M6IP63_9PROT|nr:hypothetical protein [Rhodovastum atsumiense]KAA5609245.1 hypothetical protein F1189_25035 [Rhodovastum atsumiense]CAH2601697.1 conserved protein of unknown function [Rhodovastum atsumiense]